MNAFKLCIIFLFAAAFIAACSQAVTTPNTTSASANINKPAETAPVQSATPIAEVATGEDLYITNCMVCHKDTGKGGKVTVEGKKLEPADLTADKMKKRTDEKLMKQISDGSEDDGMPAFKLKLGEEQIRSVVSYVRTLQSK